MDARAIIARLRRGEAPSQAELAWFAAGLADGTVSDAQAGAFAMAVCLQGLGEGGRTALTLAMRDSGSVMAWDRDQPVIDKHSTGGVGDCVSLLLAPALAECGGLVPMISGRGLGHTGGTLDKLEAIPGLVTQVNSDRLGDILDKAGCAIVGATSNIAPADKRLYAIRDVTATVESLDLITASILSKKLAAGLDALVLDVKIGSGAFMKAIEEARALAQALTETATAAGCKTTAVITDMNQPLGYSAGNAIEMAETVDYLNGVSREPRLHEVVCQLGASMLKSAGLASDTQTGLTMIQEAFDSGRAAKVFGAMIHALGGPANFMQAPWDYMPKAAVIRDIKSSSSGYLASVDTRGVGMSVVAMGGGRVDPAQEVDHSVGFDQLLPLGTYVNAGDTIARVHAVDSAMADQAEAELIGHYQLAATKPELAPEIYATLTPSNPK